MTQVAEPIPSQSVSPHPKPPRLRRAGRWSTLVVMIVALIACGLTGEWATDWKVHNAGDQPVQAQRGALSGMNSYALALMLGGLRGPLVMMLWSKVENQKIDRDLEDVDTMIEWIRLLQPEFDTVHIFQIWNKAYNISAMMASTADKYTTILDAVDYARRVLADRPGDMNITDQLARVLGEKLGGLNTAERMFYRHQFREDTMTDANRMRVFPEDNTTYRRMGLKFINGKNGPILDEKGNLLPPLLVEQFPRPADLAKNSEWNTGAELQYLAKYQPFPYGVPAIAMGFNYAKEAQVAMTVGGQKPLQLSGTVIDSYPGLLLKQWGEREWEHGVDYETRAFNIPATANATPMDVADASPPTAAPPTDRFALDAAVFSYGRGAQLADDAIKEYERHLSTPEYVNPYMTYTSQVAELRAERALAAGDRDYDKIFLPNADREALLKSAKAEYRDSLSRYERIILTYNVEAPIVVTLFPNQRANLDQLSDAALDQLFARYAKLVDKLKKDQHEYDDQRREYAVYLNRCLARLRQLEPQQQRSILEIH